MKFGIKLLSGGEILHKSGHITDAMRSYIEVNPRAQIVKKVKGEWVPIKK